MLSLAVIANAFLLSISLVLVLIFGIFLPGFLLKRAIAPAVAFTGVESALLSAALGVGIIDFSLLLLGRLHLPLNTLAIGLWYLVLIAVLLAVLRFRKIPLCTPSAKLLQTRTHFQVAALFIFFVFFIKAFYLSGAILPTATDLGHHLYWAKLTSDTQALPLYQKQEIIQRTDGTYALSASEPISDFIIGEHLPLSFVHIFTGASYFSTFPTLLLFALNLGSVFALAALCYYLGLCITRGESWKKVTAPDFFLLGLFVFGGLFALASPEMKFVTGGVIGNLFGNLFIPLILLVLLRALMEKSAHLLALALLLMATLAYTHHLSTFVLLFVIVFTVFTLLIFWRRQFFQESQDWLWMALTPVVLATLAGIALFALLVALPTYIETNAVSTAVGTPTKDTRTGLTLAQISLANSSFKCGLALLGLLIILGSARLRRNLGAVLMLAYGGVLMIMAMAPQLLLVDIPSARIAHYLSFPLTFLALFAVLFVIEKSWHAFAVKGAHFQNPLLLAGAILFALALVAPGLEDNGKALTANAQGLYVRETFAAAGYLGEHIRPGQLILKDHNFIEASDTWMKLFFSQGYNYPLSRSLFKRYEDNPDREQCTLALIATPNIPLGKQCYADLPIRFLVVNPKFDQAQFSKSPQFSLVYSSPDIAVFQYNQESQEESQ